MSQRLIPTGEQSGLQTRIATTESVSSCADEMLTAFLELQRAMHEFAVSLVITSLLSEIALCSSVSITTATKVPIRAIPMDD